MMPRPYWMTSMTSIVTLICLSLARRGLPRPLDRVCRASPLLALPLPRSHPLTTAPQRTQFTGGGESAGWRTPAPAGAPASSSRHPLHTSTAGPGDTRVLISRPRVGTRSGLWAALAGAGPLTTAEVAAKVSVEPSLVREWLRAQAAGGYLDYDPATGTFTLPDAVAAAICYGPGGALVDAAATMFSSMGEGFAAFSEAFSTGQGFGWHQRTGERIEILLELAASHERTGRSDLAAQRFGQAADASRAAGAAVGLARAALGIQTLGYRSGAQNADLLDLLREASWRLEEVGGPLALWSRVLAAQARTL